MSSLTSLVSDIRAAISTYFPSNPPNDPGLVRRVAVEVSPVRSAAFDANGIPDDFLGVATAVVSERRNGWFVSTEPLRQKTFAYFLRNGTDLLLTELDPSRPFSPTTGLTPVSAVHGGGSRGSGYCPAPFESAPSIAQSVNNSISIFIGEMDINLPGNEIVFNGGQQLFNIANLYSPRRR